MPMVVKSPQTNEEWEALALQFQYRWNFPNCVGAIDGKLHILIYIFINYITKVERKTLKSVNAEQLLLFSIRRQLFIHKKNA